MTRASGASLRTVQQWFADLVRSRGPIPPFAARRLADGPRLGGSEGAAVYRFACAERLRGVMANDHPAVRDVVGDGEFARLVAAYVEEHPSRHANLNQLSARFAAFLGRRRRLRGGAFTVDLAFFERAIAQATEAECVPALRLDGLLRSTPRQQRRLRLWLQPSVRLLESRWSIASWYDAWDRGEGVGPRRRANSWACVHRHGARVLRREIDEGQFAVLRRIARGATLAEAVSVAGAHAPLGEWFREWARVGLFADPTAEGSAQGRARQ